MTDWFEQGLYLPLYSFSHNDGATYNGFKLRWLFVKPHADERKFFYGVNFEFSVNQKQWDERHYTSEVRPIIGWHLRPVDIIINPIMDTSYTGGFKSLDFAPAVRVAYNLSPKWAAAIEEYADYGPFRHIYSAHDQSHQVWAVVNHEGKYVNIESGHWIRVDGGVGPGDAEADVVAGSELKKIDRFTVRIIATGGSRSNETDFAISLPSTSGIGAVLCWGLVWGFSRRWVLYHGRVQFLARTSRGHRYKASG